MKRAADRIKKQVELLGNKEYPLTFDGSENSYDAGATPTRTTPTYPPWPTG